MPTFEVIEAKPWHVGAVLRRMRHAHVAAIRGLGYDAHRELAQRFAESSFRRTWMIDGKVAGIGGVTGSLAASVGYIWLVLTEEALQYPREIVRESRKQLDEIMQTRTELVTTVVGADEAAQRFSLFMGFHVDHDNDEGLSRKGKRRAVFDRLRTDSSLKIPVRNGQGYINALGYHA